MTAPAYQAIGTAATGTTGNVQPGIPTHVAGDLAFAVAQGTNTDFGSDPNPSGTQPWTNEAFVTLGTGNDRLSAWSRLLASNADTDPTITPTSATHTYSRIITVRGAHQRFPIHAKSECMGAAGITTGSIPGLKTTIDDCLYLGILSWGVDNAGPLASAESNAALTLTERGDEGTTGGNGGGEVFYTASIASPTDVPNTQMTLSSTTFCAVSFAIAPIADIPITVAVEVDGVPHASGDGVVFLYDTSQPAANMLVLDAATETTEYVDGLDGSGEADFVVPYNDHIYVAFYTDDSAGLSGVSGPITYSGGFPTALIEISTGGGGGGGADPQLLYTKARGLSLGGH